MLEALQLALWLVILFIWTGTWFALGKLKGQIEAEKYQQLLGYISREKQAHSKIIYDWARYGL